LFVFVQKWYIISKILAEEAACKFCKSNDIDMVSMNPGIVIGPMLQPTLNETVALILNLINGVYLLSSIHIESKS